MNRKQMRENENEKPKTRCSITDKYNSQKDESFNENARIQIPFKISSLFTHSLLSALPRTANISHMNEWME